MVYYMMVDYMRLYYVMGCGGFGCSFVFIGVQCCVGGGDVWVG